MRNRVKLAQYFNKLNFKTGAEVGVFAGYYSQVLFETIPGLKLYCCDIWGWGKYKKAEDECLARLEPYNKTIIKKHSVEAANDVADSSLDFVYIDAAHDYENVKADIKAWTPKVRVGGIVAGDDAYEFPSGKGGVLRAATEYASQYQYDLKFTDWDIDNPIRDDRMPSFWFVRSHDKGALHPHTGESFDGFRNK